MHITTEGRDYLFANQADRASKSLKGENLDSEQPAAAGRFADILHAMGRPAGESTGLIVKVSEGISLYASQLDEKQMQHALFAQQLAMQGEISLQHYLIKMQNLFPQAMEALDADLRKQVDGVLALSK
jgi:hypothetical protein